MSQPLKPSQESNWPGERHPGRLDVHQANEVPETTFLQSFKAALLLSEDAENYYRQGSTNPGSEITDVLQSLSWSSTSDRVMRPLVMT